MTALMTADNKIINLKHIGESIYIHEKDAKILRDRRPVSAILASVARGIMMQRAATMKELDEHKKGGHT